MSALSGCTFIARSPTNFNVYDQLRRHYCLTDARTLLSAAGYLVAAAQWRRQHGTIDKSSLRRQERRGVRVHGISLKRLHKYNKLTLSKLKRLRICGWNRKMCGVH